MSLKPNLSAAELREGAEEFLESYAALCMAMRLLHFARRAPLDDSESQELAQIAQALHNYRQEFDQLRTDLVKAGALSPSN